jgi:hypothetical protein
MDLRATLEDRYFTWAHEELDRELACDLGRVRLVKGADTARVLTVLGDLPAGERARAVQVLFRRAHRPAVARRGEAFSEEEEGLFRAFRQRVALTLSAAELAPGAESLKRAELRKALKAELSKALGKAVHVFGGREEWRYTARIGDWLVQTDIDTGGNTRQAEYRQRVVPAAHEDAPALLEPVSLLNWLGLGGTTTWDILAAGEAEWAAQAMAGFCSHFLDAAPALLEGLRPG